MFILMCPVQLIGHYNLLKKLLLTVEGRWDSLLVRALDLSKKGCEFESWQELHENFFCRVSFLC